MLHTETIAPATLGLLKRLMQDECLSRFVLVGGTSLALQIGHRISVDLDLFSDVGFDENRMREHLETEYGLVTEYLDRETLKGEIDGVQIDCIAHKYAWVESPIELDGIRIASLKDIAAMKLNAIAGNGTRIKDFIDLAYLSTHFSLSQMLGFYEAKYHASTIMPLKAITYFDEINLEEPIRMTGGAFSWKKVAKRLLDMQKHADRIFGT